MTLAITDVITSIRFKLLTFIDKKSFCFCLISRQAILELKLKWQAGQENDLQYALSHLIQILLKLLEVNEYSKPLWPHPVETAVVKCHLLHQFIDVCKLQIDFTLHDSGHVGK